jgi:phosphate transport system substrate-binding protein
MRCDFSMGNTRMKFIAGAVLLSLASAAGAATVVGGGATLPTYGYAGQGAGAASTGAPLVPATGSLFGVYTANGGSPVTYCPTGSGAGKRILASNVPGTETGNALCLNSTSPTGFKQTGGATITQAHFAGSDAPLSAAEFTNYTNGHAGKLPEQFPSISGAIAIAFNKTGVSTLNLTEGQICGIFSGQIKTWNDAGLAGAGIPAGTTGAIKIAYRSDGSGTSFSFLNHLADVCRTQVASGKSLTAQNQFKTSQAFAATGAAAYVGSYSAGSTGANGNQGVTDFVKNNDGTIGYAEAAYPINAPTRFAAVKNLNGTTFINPQTGFGPTAVPVSLSFGKVISDTLDGNGRPVLANTPVATQCVAVVDPTTYSSPASGYPILAVTYLLGNQSGNGTDAAAIRTLLGTPYKNAPNRASVTKIGRANTGYAWLTDATVLDSTNATTGIQARINSCIN